MDKETLIIEKNCKLIEFKWIYDEQSQQGSYQRCDRTHQLIRYLFHECEIQDGVTLKDIFRLVALHLDFLDELLGNWCKDIIYEGLNCTAKPYVQDDDEIEFLELYFLPLYDKPNIHGLAYPNFHGVGFTRKEDSKYYKKGSQTPYSISLTSANDLINIPVKLNHQMVIWPDDVYTKEREPVITFEHCDFTLLQIFYGIIWELSFYGGPQQREQMTKKLDESITEIIQNKNNATEIIQNKDDKND